MGPSKAMRTSGAVLLIVELWCLAIDFVAGEKETNTIYQINKFFNNIFSPKNRIKRNSQKITRNKTSKIASKMNVKQTKKRKGKPIKNGKNKLGRSKKQMK